jgi:CubicO group peptidase (beta-lactamase class C family)
MKKYLALVFWVFMGIGMSANLAIAQKKKHVTTKKKKTHTVQKQTSSKKQHPVKTVKVHAANGLDNSLLFDRSYVLATDTEGLIKDSSAIIALNTFIVNAIYQRAFPGCQIFAAKNGKVIYSKNFGTYNYNNTYPVTDTTLYDVASCTKIVATTLALMKLYDEGKLSLDSPLVAYIPALVQNSDKARLRIGDLMLHQAGLKAWIPFYKATLDTVDKSGPNWGIYRQTGQQNFDIPVAKNLYIQNSYVDTIWKAIIESPLENLGRYVYSDLDFLFLQKVVEAITKMPLQQYVYKNFYQPLGLYHTMFNPWQRGLAAQCAPTENDMVFREQVVQGYVHDPAAAMLGGVAGHAGVFSIKTDLAVIMQLLLNGGVYNGTRYFSKETVQLFTAYHSQLSRRGYCFDKPNKDAGDGGPAANACSKFAFGHQGFTGTCVWADPATGIVFIFLSNRVYPNAENQLINRMSVRTEAQQYIYKALGY